MDMHVCMEQKKEKSLATEERVTNESSEIGGLMDILISMSSAVPCRLESTGYQVLEALSRDI
jgi:hypothetical protein